MSVIPLLRLARELSVNGAALEKPVHILKVFPGGLMIFVAGRWTFVTGFCAVLLLLAKLLLGPAEAPMEAKAAFEEAAQVWRWTLSVKVTVLEPSMMLKEGVLVGAGLPALDSAVSGAGGGVWVRFGGMVCGMGLREGQRSGLESWQSERSGNCQTSIPGQITRCESAGSWPRPVSRLLSTHRHVGQQTVDKIN